MSTVDYYYGPTTWDKDPGKMWHSGCDGEVFFIDGVICIRCGASEGYQAHQARMNAQSEPARAPAQTP